MYKAVIAVGSFGAAMFVANKVYFSGGKCYETVRLDGKLAIVTGANSGIGKETAAELARRGAHVIMACRNIELAEAAKKDILTCYGKDQVTALTKNIAHSHMSSILSPITAEQLSIEDLDLGSMKSIRNFANRVCESHVKVDILVNNAGIMACPYGETKDGFELQMGTNHLGHFLLTELLLPLVKRAGSGSRIIFLSSRAHQRTRGHLVPLNVERSVYSRFDCYCRSKLANAVYAHYLSQKLQTEGIKTASVHPGVVHTNLFKLYGPLQTFFLFITRPFMKTSWEGAQTTVYTIVTPNLVTGAYYSDCAVSNASPCVDDDKLAESLVEASRKACQMD